MYIMLPGSVVQVITRGPSGSVIWAFNKLLVNKRLKERSGKFYRRQEKLERKLLRGTECTSMAHSTEKHSDCRMKHDRWRLSSIPRMVDGKEHGYWRGDGTGEEEEVGVISPLNH